MSAAHAQALAESVRGPVFTPDSDGYDEARTVYNAMIRRRPDAVVRAADAADVMATIRHAATHDLDLAVRGGGHSVPGYGTCDGGVVLDLSGMRNVRVDPAARTARIGGGGLLGDLDHATHPFGLATPGGIISTTGVGGYTLGGGVGSYLHRRFGLTCDNLISADVVTADGRQVRASEDENPDLFWALRGGGGNFGVVTSFEFRLHPVREIVGGPLFFDMDDAPRVLRFFRDFIADAPREMGGFVGFHRAPPLPFVPEERHDEPMVVVVTCWSGEPAEADALIDEVRAAAPVVAEHVGPMPYPALQNAFDALVPPGLQHYWKADYVKELTDEAVAAHCEFGARVPHVSTAVHLYPLGGAVADVDEDATAFAHRDADFVAVIAGMWPDPDDNDANIRWVRDYYEAIHPHSGFDGGYINFMGADDAGRARENYGGAWDKLGRAKARWDPDNLFRMNQNVRPVA